MEAEDKMLHVFLFIWSQSCHLNGNVIWSHDLLTPGWEIKSFTSEDADIFTYLMLLLHDSKSIAARGKNAIYFVLKMQSQLPSIRFSELQPPQFWATKEDKGSHAGRRNIIISQNYWVVEDKQIFSVCSNTVDHLGDRLLTCPRIRFRSPNPSETLSSWGEILTESAQAHRHGSVLMVLMVLMKHVSRRLESETELAAV